MLIKSTSKFNKCIDAGHNISRMKKKDYLQTKCSNLVDKLIIDYYKRNANVLTPVNP